MKDTHRLHGDSAASPDQVQQKLLEYEAILENASVGILFTRDRKVLHCNPKYSEIFGWPQGELVGQPGRVFHLSDEDYAEFGRIATPILSSGGLLDRQLRMARKDGLQILVHLRAKAINPVNTAEGTIWIAEDIGERQHAQVEMENLLLRQQAILNNASVGIQFTLNGIFVHSNARAEEIYGWPVGTLVGQKGSVIFKDEEDYALFGRRVGQQLAAGERIDIEWLNVRKDGSLFWCRHLAKALQTTDGSHRTIWISEDISEKKRTEFALQELLLRQEAILTNASVAIVFAHDGVIVQCNPRTEELFGWEPGSLTGQEVRALFNDKDDFRRFSQIVTPGLTAGELIDIEWLNTRKDGTQFWCRSLARSLPSQEGSFSTIWINDDISARKTAAEELQRAYQEMEQRVQERTAELEAVLRSSPLAIYTRDLQNRITSWNPAAEKMFGWTVAEVIGKPIPTIPDSERAQADDLARRISQGEALLQLEVLRRRRDGDLIHISHTVAPLVDAHGKLYGSLTIAADITESRAAAQKIEFLAYHDALTGLPNRTLLQDRLQHDLALAERNQSHLALLFVDLDNFKKINDSLGHAAGDALLKEVAIRLQQCLRDTDTISRQGGDEFVVILSGLGGPDDSLPVLTKMIDKLQEPIVADGKELSTSVSIGIAFYPEDGADFDTLGKKADMAMYRAKEAGRNTYRFFDEAMDREAMEHLLMRNGLRHALEHREFILHFQPQLNLMTGQVSGAEALLRWQHPELGLVLPDRFIPVAEDSGLIVPISDWVLQQACTLAANWRHAQLPPLTVAVNLSAVHFKRANVELAVIEALDRSGLDPTRLELELTESTLIQDVDQVSIAIRRLKRMGVKISIDDFGTGYSSLSYLKKLDVHKLKIDRSFIRDLATDPDDAAIVRAVIQMAHSLGLRTIAEGVETPDMLAQLRSFGCDEAQGYHFAHPMPADEFERYLAACSKSSP